MTPATTEFLLLLQQFREIQRNNFAGSSIENDAEHSYQLAMMAWYLVGVHNLSLDRDKILRYALVHDLLEVKIGDRNAYISTQEDRDQKNKASKTALIELKQQFNQADDIFMAIEEYDSLFDEESRFVYALDKLLPVFNMMTSSQSWHKEHGTSFEEHNMYIQDRIEKSRLRGEPSFVAIQEILDIIKQNQDDIFSQK